MSSHLNTAQFTPCHRVDILTLGHPLAQGF